MKWMRKILACVLAAVMLMLSASAVFAEAQGSAKAAALQKFEEMKNNSIEYEYSNNGIYSVKTTKFYVREVTGVADDRSFILSPWRLVINESANHVSATLPGTCVQFAFGFDILWGTDWPYSGVFWTDVNTPVHTIGILSNGLVRSASLKIDVNRSRIFDDWNLPSHSEWTP